jgi:hypothetical protein
MGCSYTPEELGAAVNIEGEVIDIPSTESPAEGAPFVAAPIVDHSDPGDYIMPFGQWKGEKLSDLDIYKLDSYCAYIVREAKAKNKPITGQVAEALAAAEAFLIDREHGSKEGA